MANRSYRPIAERRARSFRKSMTPAERHLWYDYLRNAPWKFQRQKPIGLYIVDFICFSAHLIIELDGDSHSGEEAYAHDERRTKYLQEQGFRVLRLTNRDIQNNFPGVCRLIAQAVNDPDLHGRIGSDSMGNEKIKEQMS